MSHTQEVRAAEAFDVRSASGRQLIVYHAAPATADAEALTFGDVRGWGADDAECARVFERYADMGGNLIDTAKVYTGGSSERILGKLLNGRQDRFVPATKFTEQTVPGDLNSAGNHRKNLRMSVEASLGRLEEASRPSCGTNRVGQIRP